MTLKIIAKEAGVSTATVSNVLNNTGAVSDKTKKKVLSIIEEYNYRPNRIARSLRHMRTNTIGVLCEDITVFNAPYIINGINQFAEENNYHILLSDLRLDSKMHNRFDEITKYIDRVKEAVDMLLSAKVDGIIYLSMHDRDISGIVGPLQIPIVYAYASSSRPEDVCVSYDNRNIAEEAVQLLIDHGHKDIAIITGPVDSPPAHQRLMGYQRVLMKNGLPLNVSYIKVGNWESESGYKYCRELMEMANPPTAIYATNDNMSFGVLKAAADMGIRIPEELSVIGYGRSGACELSYPSLSAIWAPLKKIGYIAGDYIVQLIRGSVPEEKKVFLPCKIINRASVGAVPNRNGS